MRLTILWLSAALLIAPMARPGPVVVELFTSQGCSSCPPADAFARALGTQKGVIPLSYHVDYWNRLGWEDSFSSSENTARQYAYGRRFRNRSVWTPQFVVGGEAWSNGPFREMVMASIDAQAQRPDRITLRREGARLLLAPRAQDLPEMEVLVARIVPQAQVNITAGENAGQRITYSNIVTRLDLLARWDGSEPLALDLPEGPAVIMVQQTGHGPIMGAMQLGAND